MRALFLLNIAFAGCTSPADVGDACTDSADCMAGLSCFEHTGAAEATVCMADCDYDEERLCEDGSVCTMAMGTGRPANLGVCYLGGAAALGSACASNFDCVRGAICVDVAGELGCYEACSTDVEGDCGEGQTCRTLEGMGTRGFCADAP